MEGSDPRIQQREEAMGAFGWTREAGAGAAHQGVLHPGTQSRGERCAQSTGWHCSRGMGKGRPHRSQ